MNDKMSHSISGKATAYCLTGKTSTGSKPGPGTIAVDPKVIPYKKNLHVTWNGGSYDGVSLDTGGACRQGKIVCDLWFSTKKECDDFGRRDVTVTWDD